MGANETQLVGEIRTAIRDAWSDSYFQKQHGSALTGKGVPDLMGCVEGLFVAIEVKHAKPHETVERALARVTPEQEAHGTLIRRAGGVFIRGYDPAQVVAEIAAALEARQ